jgi:peroxiredoxin
MAQLIDLPTNLPIPLDDGKCNHLQGMYLPNITLNSTNDNKINLAELKGLNVLYFYPMTGRPDVELPEGWNEIPGARGCTPQSCSFRDNNQVLTNLNAKVYGISTQSTAYQKEMVERLHLPFEVLSDEDLKLAKELNLPTLIVNDMTLIKRITLICKDNKIVKVFYPVFPPDKNVDEVINWIENN